MPLLFLFTVIVASTFARPHNYSSLPYAHPAVLEIDAQEALYPSHFRNPYYKTPRQVGKISKTKI